MSKKTITYYKCNKDLRMKFGGQLSFKKGGIYKCTHEGNGFLNLVDAMGCSHSVTDKKEEGNWKKHFTKIESK